MNDNDIKNRVKQFIDRLCRADKCNILANYFILNKLRSK